MRISVTAWMLLRGPEMTQIYRFWGILTVSTRGARSEPSPVTITLRNAGCRRHTLGVEWHHSSRHSATRVCNGLDVAEAMK